MKTVDTINGKMWQSSLRQVYDDFAEFQAYDEIYGIVKRLGFESAKDAWLQNPTIRGSVNPADLQVVPKKKAKQS